MSAAATNAPSVIDLYRRHLSVGRARLAAFSGGAIERSSSGTRVRDDSGRDHLDCGGYGVFLLGHGHPVVVDAVVAQIRRHAMATRMLLEPTAAVTAAALADVAPPGLRRAHFTNSGAETVEAAIKLARAHGRTTLVSARGGFHGKTTGALSLTPSELYQAPFRPLLADVRHVTYGDARALDELLHALPGRACVVLEPVQGEAGVVIPPRGYLRAAARICREHGALLVLDEVQTGLGRLGSWWGADAEGVVPDMLLVGKGLSGGIVPVAALLATDDIYEPFSTDPYLHTSTFAASPVAMAAAAATVGVLRTEGLVERSRALGEELLALLADLVAEHFPEIVVDVRGRGLLIGIEFADEALAGAFVLELLARRVLVNHSLNAHRVVRLTPPATLSRTDVDWLSTACAAAGRAVRDASGHRNAGAREARACHA